MPSDSTPIPGTPANEPSAPPPSDSLDRPARVLVVEDNSSYREALAGALSDSTDLELVGAFSSFESAIASLRDTAPDVVLLDLGLPGMSGLDGIPEVAQLAPGAHVLVLTQFDDKPRVFQAISRGAAGYLLKTASLDEILRGIAEVMAGGAPLNAQIARMVLTTFNHVLPKTADNPLTQRETEILTRLSEGHIKKEVADQLDISYHTVDMHVRNIYRKLQVQNLSGAISRAIKRGIL